MGDCVKSNNFYQSLVHLANNSNLPVSTAYFIVKNFYNEMTIIYEDSIREEMSQSNNPQENLNLEIDGDGNVSINKELINIEE